MMNPATAEAVARIRKRARRTVIDPAAPQIAALRHVGYVQLQITMEVVG